MASYTDELRASATEMRGHVKAMLDRIGSARSLSVELAALADTPGVPEDVRRRLLALAETAGGDNSVPLITAIAGSVTANFYDALADQTDYIKSQGSLRSASDKIRAHRQMQQALNIAAAAGDWERFDELVERLARGDTGEGKGGSAPTSDNVGGHSATPENGGRGDGPAES